VPQLPQEQPSAQLLEQRLELHVEKHGEESTLDIAVVAAPPPPTPGPETEPELDPGQQTPIGNAIIVATSDAPTPSAPPSTGRSRRARVNQPVYNLAKLSGTDIHGKRRANGDIVREKRRRTTGDVSVTVNTVDPVVRDGIDALDIDWSIPSTPRGPRTSSKSKPSPAREAPTRRATRLSGAPTETLATKVSALGKRSRKTFEKGLSRLSREIRRLQDTDEFAHIDSRPVVQTVWSNGKFLDPREVAEEAAAAERARKRAKTTAGSEAQLKQEEAQKREEEAKEAKAGPAKNGVRVKKWLVKGLYAGQETPSDITQGLTAQEKKKLAQIPELAAGTKPNKSLPMPMFNGLRLLLNGRDFKLPYDICNPLPPGQPKPAAYRTMTKSEFVLLRLPTLHLSRPHVLTRHT
jgi:histone-lysine N-methyltransferase ASH1L